MATFLYNKGREGFLDGSIDWDTNDIKLLMCTGGYAPASSTADTFVSDVTNEGTSTRSGNFASKTVTSGVADAADVTLTAVPVQTALANIVIYKDTGVDGTSRLIAFIDNATGLPVTPNGGDITISWSNGANKIFKL